MNTNNPTWEEIKDKFNEPNNQINGVVIDQTVKDALNDKVSKEELTEAIESIDVSEKLEPVIIDNVSFEELMQLKNAEFVDNQYTDPTIKDKIKYVYDKVIEANNYNKKLLIKAYTDDLGQNTNIELRYNISVFDDSVIEEYGYHIGSINIIGILDTIVRSILIFKEDESYIIYSITENDLDKKVDKEKGKSLSTNDFTNALNSKLEGLTNYDDTVLSNKLATLENNLNTILDSNNTTQVIDTFQEIEQFLAGITNQETLTGLLQEMKSDIIALCNNNYVNKNEVTTSGESGKIPIINNNSSIALKGIESLGKNVNLQNLGWYRIYDSNAIRDNYSRNCIILMISTSYNNTYNESYIVAITNTFSDDSLKHCDIVQLSGISNIGNLIQGIRVLKSPNKPIFIDLCYSKNIVNEVCVFEIGAGNFQKPTLVDAEIPEGYISKLFMFTTGFKPTIPLLTNFTNNSMYNQLNISVNGVDKTINLYPLSIYGYRYLYVPDNSGHNSLVLISNINSWKGSTSNAYYRGFSGNIEIVRTGGYVSNSRDYINCACSYKDVNSYNWCALYSTNGNIVPQVVKYNNDYYLAIEFPGSGRQVIMSGYFVSCMNDFIILQLDSNRNIEGLERLNYTTIIPKSNLQLEEEINALKTRIATLEAK